MSLKIISTWFTTKVTFQQQPIRTIACLLILSQYISFIARTSVTPGSVGTVVVTLAIVHITLVNICRNIMCA